MKTYEVSLEDFTKIRNTFSGAVFTRQENGKNYIKCGTKRTEEYLKTKFKLS